MKFKDIILEALALKNVKANQRQIKVLTFQGKGTACIQKKRHISYSFVIRIIVFPYIIGFLSLIPILCKLIFLFIMLYTICVFII